MAKKISNRDAEEFCAKGDQASRLWDREEGLFLRPRQQRSGTWGFRYRTPLTRQQREIRLGRWPAISPQQARSLARERAAEIAAGSDPREARQKARSELQRQNEATIGAFLKGSYGLYLGGRKSGRETRQMLERYFGAWLDRPMGDLTRGDIRDWVRESITERKLAWPTITRSWDALRALLNRAVEEELLEANPLAGFKIQAERPAVAPERQQSQKRRSLEPEEETAFLRGVALYSEERREERRRSRTHGKPHLPSFDGVDYPDWVAPWLLLAFFTGFRGGDINGLRWEEVDLRFSESITKVPEKTAHQSNKPRQFPLNRQALKVLSTWHAERGKPTLGWVFPSPRTGGRLDKSATRKPRSRVKRLGGFPNDLTLYSLRHHFASKLITQGVDLFTVSQLMGHSSIETTIAHYSHLRPGQSREAVEVFSASLGGAGGKR